MITGPFLSDGGLTLICIMFLINQFMHKRFNILKIDKFGKFFYLVFVFNWTFSFQ